MDLNVLIGGCVVMLVAYQRFNVPPPGRRPAREGLPQALKRVHTWFEFGPDPAATLFPPPRANTTVFKFWLYSTLYATTGIAVYAALLRVPGLAGQVQQIIDMAGGGKKIVLEDAGPVVLAFLVSVLFPVIPPLRNAERSIRRTMYERACIPAQQLRERNRLREARYEVRPDVLETVRARLGDEGFCEADIVYESTPTVRSMWTKAALLIAHVETWQGKDRYKTAFALLRERDGATLSVDRVLGAFEALKADARVCFAALRERPGAPETEARKAEFRRNCGELLVHVYDLLSRVSLKSHFTERERIACMGEIGFRLTPPEGGPIPDVNDLVWLAIVLAGVLLLPLSVRLGVNRGLMIVTMMYAAVLVPILIAHRYPGFAAQPERNTPAVAFPVVSGLAAAVLAGVIAVAWQSIDLGQAGSRPEIDVAVGWARYVTRGYAWTPLYALLAALIAWRTHTGAYPDVRELRGVACYREWGSLRDGLLFVAGAVGLMLGFVQRQPAAPKDVLSVLIVAGLALAIGFFVPTWYRAHRRRADAQPAPDRQLDPAPRPAPASAAS
jgi:hypothetical protein